jgi:hypothetical protein
LDRDAARVRGACRPSRGPGDRQKRGRVRFGQRTVLVPSHTPARAKRRRVPALGAGGSERSSPDRFHADHGVAVTEHAGCRATKRCFDGPLAVHAAADVAAPQDAVVPRDARAFASFASLEFMRSSHPGRRVLPSTRSPALASRSPGDQDRTRPHPELLEARPEAGTRATPVPREPEQALTYLTTQGKCEAAG